ncbi:gliding motility-associated C-terminal domain-containing protein [Flavobacterium longum]|uniref:gliding motility-associated C-terminal domain-containing protein n=1 Tax=Flavobacterium longum TaxID=1299340 RepID=UPI0039EB1773
MLFLCIVCLLFPRFGFGQDISLYQQFNGRYDFLFVGNTLNPVENSFQSTVAVNTTSSATMALQPTDVIEKAYLYWAGCGTGDFDVALNGQPLTAERTFAHTRFIGFLELNFFSAFVDVTSQVIATGNGNYTLSDLDVSDHIVYHSQASTNFAGWALIIVYKNDALPLNQLNVYDGLQAVPTEISIDLNSLNVIDNDGARIGFLAWEGDSGIAVNETLRINGQPLSSLPLNPVNNAFNGTNSFTGSNQLYNMDLDVYNIQNFIDIGDTSANISLTSGQDFVMVNAIVTKLNSQLPDATIIAGNVQRNCDSRVIVLDYMVSNTNCTDFLPAETPIAFYADGVLVGQALTFNDIPIGGAESGQITLTIPDNIPLDFTLTLAADDMGDGNGHVTELVETNNLFVVEVSLLVAPPFNELPPLESCNLGFTRALFDFSSYEDLVRTDAAHTVSFHDNLADAENDLNPIFNTSNYLAQATPKEIFVRIENGSCFAVTSFMLQSKNCPPTVYNYVSANEDGTNDSFFIDGLRDIFVNFQLEIYNRWGVLVWEGNNNTEDWRGVITKGLRIDGNEAPDGTYFYVLDLNDPGFPEPYTGFLYLNR